MNTPPSSPATASRFGSLETDLGQTNSLSRKAPLRETSFGVHSSRALSIFKSRFVLALVVFLAGDLLVRFNFHPDRFDLPEHNYIWWAVKGFKELDRMPDLVIFGSSLMLSVTNDGDAVYLKQPIDGAIHHRSICIEKVLERKLNYPWHSYSFAVGGQMASDVYAIQKTMFDAQHRPKLVIWGIAPRDFVDAAFDGPYSSDTAHFMNKIADSPVIPPAHRSLPSLIENSLSKISALFQRRSNIICLAQNFLRQRRAEIRQVGRSQALKLLDRPLKCGLEPSQDIEIGDWITPICTVHSDSLKDNSAEYRQRYNPFKTKSFEEQLAYLEKFLLLNQELGTKVVLVNMPLTADNLRLLPSGIYKTYLAKISILAQKYGAKIIDFNTANLFSRNEFADTAHLNGLGGERLARLLSDRLAKLWQANEEPLRNFNVTQ